MGGPPAATGTARLGPQGLAELDELPLSALHALFGELAGVAAHRSVVVGELPAMRGDKAQELLAAHGFLGWPIAFGSEEAADYGRWRGAGLEAEALDGEPRRLLFRAQQTRASTYQADVIMRFRFAMAIGMVVRCCIGCRQGWVRCRWRAPVVTFILRTAAGVSSRTWTRTSRGIFHEQDVASGQRLRMAFAGPPRQRTIEDI